MKTSKETQKKTKARLLAAAVVLMAKQGYEKTSMRDISRKAKVSDATIYRYFPTKESLVLGYFEQHVSEAGREVNAIPDFKQYQLNEKLQAYFEILLNGYAPDRLFLKEVIPILQQFWLTHHEELSKINEFFLTEVRTFLLDAIESQEIPNQPIGAVIPHLILDFYLMMVLFWIKDTSDQFSKTTRVIDMGTDILIGILKQGLIAKVVDMGVFLFRHHFLSQSSILSDLMSFSQKKEP